MSSQADSNLLRLLPYDLRYIIYEELRYLIINDSANGERTADVSMAPPKKRGRRAMRLRNMFPRLVADFNGILMSCKDMHEEVEKYLSQKVLYVSKHSSGIQDMPLVFGQDNCLLIRRFELRMEFQMKVNHQRQWPAFLKLLLTYLPNLEFFSLYSEWCASQVPYPENESGDPPGTMSRFDQERRAKMRFLSWLIHYSPSLDLLIRPANTGPTWRSGEHTYKHNLIAEKHSQKHGRVWKRATKFVGPLPDGQVTRETAVFTDEVFDTTLIRRLRWDQYANLDETSYFITPEPDKPKDSITTSEVDHGDSAYFEQLDERGYRPREVFDRLGWTHTGPVQVDKLIAKGFRMKAIAAEREERLQREAQSVPGMTRGGGSSCGSRGGNRGRGSRGGGRGSRGGRGRGWGRGQGRGQGRGGRGGLVTNETA